jgi:hypothetical protein
VLVQEGLRLLLLPPLLDFVEAGGELVGLLVRQADAVEHGRDLRHLGLVHRQALDGREVVPARVLRHAELLAERLDLLRLGVLARNLGDDAGERLVLLHERLGGVVDRLVAAEGGVLLERLVGQARAPVLRRLHRRRGGRGGRLTVCCRCGRRGVGSRRDRSH